MCNLGLTSYAFKVIFIEIQFFYRDLNFFAGADRKRVSRSFTLPSKSVFKFEWQDFVQLLHSWVKC